MPLAFNIRLVALSTLFYAYHVTKNVPQYFILITQTAYVLFIVFGRPHKKAFDLIRSLCLEIGLLYVLTMRFVEVHVLAEYV